MNDPRALHAYTLISTLHPQPHAAALIEITGLAPKTKPVKNYFFSADLATKEALELNGIGYSVFVNINPRKAFSGFEQDVPYVSALALDLQPERTSIAEVEKRLAVAGIPPSITGVSGNGAHFYLLVEPAEPVRAKVVWERLCKFTVSDAVFNTNRIFRCAGTINWKPPAPRWCYLTGVWADRRYTVEYVDSRLNAVGAPPARTPKEGIPVPADPPGDWFELRKRLHAGVLDIIDTGERNAYSDKQISRSEADWVVVCALINAGCNDEWIHWIYEKQPVGMMKYRDAGPAYLNRTIESARRATAAPRGPSAPTRSGQYSTKFTGGAGDARRLAHQRKFQQ